RVAHVLRSEPIQYGGDHVSLDEPIAASPARVRAYWFSFLAVLWLPVDGGLAPVKLTLLRHAPGLALDPPLGVLGGLVRNGDEETSREPPVRSGQIEVLT